MWYNRPNDSKNRVYRPTPEQIRAACRQIQAEWSDEDERKHRGARRDTVLWNVPIVEFEEGDFRNLIDMEED